MPMTMRIAVTLKNGGSKSVIDTDVPVGSTPESRRELVEDLMKRADAAVDGIVPQQAPAPLVLPVLVAAPVAPPAVPSITPGKMSAFHAKCNGLGIRNRKIELLNVRFGKISPGDLTDPEGDTVLDQLSAVEQGQITVDDLFRAA